MENFGQYLTTLLYIFFVVTAITLIVVVLLQEGKGGGFGQFLGEGGQQTFGVGARGINTFTGYVAAAFLVSALVLHVINEGAGTGSITDGLEPLPPTQEYAPGMPGGMPGGTGIPDLPAPPAGGSEPIGG